MELSQRLDLAKLGLSSDLNPDTDSEADTDSGAEKPPSDSRAGGDTLAQLAGLLAKVGAVEEPSEVHENDTLDKLGVDSLTRIELAVRAEEEFGVRVDTTTLDPASTAGEMAQFFSKSAGERAAR